LVKLVFYTIVANDHIILFKNLYHPRTYDCKEIETNIDDETLF